MYLGQDTVSISSKPKPENTSLLGRLRTGLYNSAAIKAPKIIATSQDWPVSRVDFPNKLIMRVDTFPRAPHAQETSKELLVTMSANVVC